MALLQEHFRRHGAEEGMKKLRAFGIREKRAGPLWLLKYDQISSPMGNALVQLSRGIVLDSSRDWAIVVFPYEKFFNFGESNAAKLDWLRPVWVSDKVDGTLCTVYYFDNKWCVATTGLPDASGLIYINSRVKHAQAFSEDGEEGGDDLDPSDPALADVPRMTFAKYFWEVWARKGYKLPGVEDQGKCFMFELATPYNRVVVAYEEENLLLHGCRDLTTLLEEEPAPFATKYGWSIAKSYSFNSLEEVVAASRKLDASKAEGFVVRDAQFRRVKVKSPMYVQVALLSATDKDGLNARHLIEVILLNEGSEFLSYFPQWQALYTLIKDAFERYIALLEMEYAALKDLGPKEFAAASAAVHSDYRGSLFVLRKGSDARSAVSGLQPRRLLELLGKHAGLTLPKQEDAQSKDEKDS